MKSYFVRHANKLRVIEDAIDHLWTNNLIGIHFPEVPENDHKDIGDKTSINVDDYKTKAARAGIPVFRELNDEGGYIWAEYRNKALIKVLNSLAFQEF